MTEQELRHLDAEIAEMMPDQHGTPERESFYFGFDICALCLDFHPIPLCQRVSRFIWPAEHGVGAEIIIPAGRQAFHRKCWNALKGTKQ